MNYTKSFYEVFKKQIIRHRVLVVSIGIIHVHFRDHRIVNIVVHQRHLNSTKRLLGMVPRNHIFYQVKKPTWMLMN